jgi:hypothetical protein
MRGPRRRRCCCCGRSRGWIRGMEGWGMEKRSSRRTCSWWSREGSRRTWGVYFLFVVWVEMVGRLEFGLLGYEEDGFDLFTARAQWIGWRLGSPRRASLVGI